CTTCARRSTSLSTGRCCTRYRARATGSPTSSSRRPDRPAGPYMPQRLPSRLRRRFLIQAALASVVLVAAITSGGAWALHVLIDARLQTQAGEFWAQRAANPGFVPAG